MANDMLKNIFKEKKLSYTFQSICVNRRMCVIIFLLKCVWEGFLSKARMFLEIKTYDEKLQVSDLNETDPISQNFKMNFNIWWLMFFSLTILFINVNFVNGYLPVVFIPGIDNQTSDIQKVCDEVEKLHPGTTTILVYLGGYSFSMSAMWKQIDIYRAKMDEIFKKYPDGVHILAHSQGTLIARAIIQTTPNHSVKNFLSVAGPFMGQYGIPKVVERFLETKGIFNVTRKDLYRLAYISLVQDTVSVAGYWNDPTKQKLFLKKSKFLPKINNLVDHPDYTEYKKNFLRLNNMILIGGDKEEVIIPWQTTLAGFYDKDLNIVPMEEQYGWLYVLNLSSHLQIYINDTFGLRTLDERGGLILVNISGVHHNDYFINMSYTEKI
uniref:palmitoyl-CoA hydrolase n=1 Tax=Strigamia maritima TaxID=126957 RepID=T1IZX6_STRMM